MATSASNSADNPNIASRLPYVLTDRIAIDLTDACNLSCNTCPRGLRLMKNHRGQMHIHRFEQALAKAKANNIKKLELYNWTEPFLCKSLYKYTRLARDYGFSVDLSSNLSFIAIPDMIEALKYVDYIIVSVSGFNQKTYAVNHRGGNVENVKRNICIVGQARKEGIINTDVVVRYFDFPHSLPEFSSFEQFANESGVRIELMKATGNPEVRSARPKAGIFPVPPLNYVSLAPCVIAGWRMPLDMHGNAYLCCAVVNSKMTRIGNFFTDDFEVLEYRRHVHPMCANCRVKRPGHLHDQQVLRIASGARKLLLEIQDEIYATDANDTTFVAAAAAPMACAERFD